MITFAEIRRQLVENGLLRMSCNRFFDTTRNELEFYVHMQECMDIEEAVKTWVQMEKMALPFSEQVDKRAFSNQVQNVPRQLHRVARRLRRLLE